jgi:hypothetical protein
MAMPPCYVEQLGQRHHNEDRVGPTSAVATDPDRGDTVFQHRKTGEGQMRSRDG